ncbi:hypothetical protein [Polyangium sp. 6x1]|uniref:hypothetical protein n=1 Tax=Polyangium sp. 6x1 TaxID=3042689 RepID=UPI0024830BA5|nr:hypothetical protein [Polyangium sp. 6x1]MDI1447926.1 hypothetical protein [Polyangium sp. 6x1]
MPAWLRWAILEANLAMLDLRRAAVLSLLAMTACRSSEKAPAPAATVIPAPSRAIEAVPRPSATAPYDLVGPQSFVFSGYEVSYPAAGRISHTEPFDIAIMVTRKGGGPVRL